MFRRILLASAVAIGPSGPAWADPDYNPPFVFQYGKTHPVISNLSCTAARNIVRAEGYRRVVASNCGSKTYAFHALHNGHAVIVRVNARNGRLLSEARQPMP
jgi:hypothetical protein